MGVVSFSNPNYNYLGTIRNGIFTLGGLKEGNGLPPGSYTVHFYGTDQEDLPLFATKYQFPDSSGIICEVEPGKKIGLISSWKNLRELLRPVQKNHSNLVNKFLRPLTPHEQRHYETIQFSPFISEAGLNSCRSADAVAFSCDYLLRSCSGANTAEQFHSHGHDRNGTAMLCS